MNFDNMDTHIIVARMYAERQRHSIAVAIAGPQEPPWHPPPFLHSGVTKPIPPSTAPRSDDSLIPEPPLMAEIVSPTSRSGNTAPKGFLVDLLMPPDRADDALLNILGGYDRWVKKYGIRTARRMFMTHSAGTVLTFWTDWLLRRIKLLEMWRRS
jgi:hypothetical protein